MVATFQLQGHAGAGASPARASAPRPRVAPAAAIQARHLQPQGGGRPGIPRGARNDDAPRAPASQARALPAAASSSSAADPFPMDQPAALTDF